MDRAGVEYIAREFYDMYALLAAEFSTGRVRVVPWDRATPQRRELVLAVVQALVDRGIIR